MPRVLPILVVLLAVASAADAADIVFRERIVPTGAVIRLGDIATVLRATPAEAKRLADLPLMPAPAPGTEQTVRAQEIRDLLVAHGLELANLRFDGANRITIGVATPAASPTAQLPAAQLPAAQTQSPAQAPGEPAGRTMSPRPRQQTGFRQMGPTLSTTVRRPQRASLNSKQLLAIKQQLTETLNGYVQQQLGDPMVQVLDFELTPRNAENVAVATGEIVVMTTSPLETGKQRLLVSFPTADGPVRFPVFASVERATPAVICTRAVSRGAVITASDIRLAPLTGASRVPASETLIATLEDAIGKEAGRSIRPGQPLTDRNCMQPVMVRRGDVVDVMAGGGGIRIRRRCTAKRDGRLGETIQVETIDGKTKLAARVVGYRELAVLSSDGAASSYLSGATADRRIR